MGSKSLIIRSVIFFALVCVAGSAISPVMAQDVFDAGANLLDEAQTGLLGYVKPAGVIALIVLALHGFFTRRFNWAWIGAVAGGLVIVALSEPIIEWLFGVGS